MVKRIEKAFVLLLGILLFILSACGTKAEAAAEYPAAAVRTPPVEEPLSTEQAMWNYLLAQYSNQYAAAALLGNADFEMALCPYRVEGDKVLDEDGSYPASLEYTAKVDSGEITRENFAYAGPSGGGYGLFAWTSPGRKEGLYDLAKERGVSVSDWKTQLDYAYKEITDRYYDLYCTLLTADNLEDAVWAFGYYFEQATGIQTTVSRRTDIAQEYYNRYADHAFICPYKPDTLLPIDGSYDYLEQEYAINEYESCLPVFMAQTVLKAEGYTKAEPCGYLGPETAAVLEDFQFDNNLELTGILDPPVWRLLYEKGT